MDREIKFRVWLPKEPESEEYIVEYEMCYDLAFEDYEPINDLLNGVNNLMQYTGLKDKFGMEIYEGDIVTDAVGRTWLIQYSVKLCSFVFNWINKKSITNEIQTLQNFNSAQLPFTKEGNIYENPELLKQQEVKND